MLDFSAFESPNKGVPTSTKSPSVTNTSASPNIIFDFLQPDVSPSSSQPSASRNSNHDFFDGFDFVSPGGSKSESNDEITSKSSKKNKEVKQDKENEKLERKKSDKSIKDKSKKKDEERKKKEEEERKRQEKEKKKSLKLEKEEKERKKKEEEEERKKQEKEKKKSLKKADIKEITDQIKETAAPTSTTTTSPATTGEGEEELSKEDEPPLHWIPKLKKAHRSILITITNHTLLSLEISSMHESKGRWRRKPPEFINPKSAIQFAVEGKITPEGSCSYNVEGVASPIQFIWAPNRDNKDTPVISFVLPAELDHIELSHTDKLDKFSDINFDIKDKYTETKKDTKASSLSNSSTSVNSVNEISHLEDKTAETPERKPINPNDSSSDDEDEEENKKKTMFRHLSFKPIDQVEQVDPKTLQAAASSLNLGAISTLASRTRGRGRKSNSPSSTLTEFPKEDEKKQLPTDTTTTTTTDSTTTVSTNNENHPPTFNELPPSTKNVAVQSVEESSKALMKEVFSKLEAGEFREALRVVNEVLKLLVSVPDPLQKQREAKICSMYKFSLKLLISKSESKSPEVAAKLTTLLAQLPLQPKHRLVCVRMAIKSNIAVRNFATAANFIQMLLPLHLADHSTHEATLETCKQNNMQDFSTSIPLPSTCCYQTLELLPSTYYECTYCDAKFSVGATNPQQKCTYCDYGLLTSPFH